MARIAADFLPRLWSKQVQNASTASLEIYSTDLPVHSGASAALKGSTHAMKKPQNCCGGCGPGDLHLNNGLVDCHRRRVPVLAIAAHLPSSELGVDYSQATRPEILFRECSQCVDLVSNPGQTEVTSSWGSLAIRRPKSRKKRWRKPQRMPARRRSMPHGTRA